VIERASLDEISMQYMYSDSAVITSWIRAVTSKSPLSDEVLATRGLPGAGIRHQGRVFRHEPVGIELPQTIDLTVTDTAPAIKGSTASAQLKPATLETGLVVSVPPFINVGDKVRVNTESGEYQGRA